ncbi:RNA-binding domain-containing protein [Backusella circina FSU 941]|nr:RNA-binding domain-containing protein [Backusella circina FSU 941]
MASKLDIALDDVIKERRNENRGKRGGNNRSDFGTRRRDGGNIRKRNDNGGSGAFAARSFVRSIQVPERRDGGREKRNVNGQWSHDKFVDEVGPSSSSSINSRLGGSRLSGSTVAATTELAVENLHYNVTENDLLELFSTVGDVQKARIKFDPSGRSTGAAFVKYVNTEDAKEAAKKYDGVLLDGQPMRIEIKERERNESRGNNHRGGRNNNFRSGNKNSNNRNRNGGNRSFKDRNSDRNNKNLTAEDLDREMESYMTNNDNDMVLD